MRGLISNGGPGLRAQPGSGLQREEEVRKRLRDGADPAEVNTPGIFRNLWKIQQQDTFEFSQQISDPVSAPLQLKQKPENNKLHFLYKITHHHHHHITIQFLNPPFLMLTLYLYLCSCKYLLFVFPSVCCLKHKHLEHLDTCPCLPHCADRAGWALTSAASCACLDP